MSYGIYSNYKEKDIPIQKYNNFIYNLINNNMQYINFIFLLKHKNIIPFRDISPNLLLIKILGNKF